MKILVVDQFSGITPYWLSQNPILFNELCAEAHIALERQQLWGFTSPRLLDVEESWTPEIGQTALRAGKDGLVEIWKCKWDTSG